MLTCKDLCEVKHEKRCCRDCERAEICGQACQQSRDKCGFDGPEIDTTDVIGFQNHYLGVMTKISDLMLAKKNIEEQEKTLKDQLRQAMEENGIKSVDSPVCRITWVAEGEVKSVDSTRLKKDHPKIFESYQKTTKRSAYIKIEAKKG